MDKPVTQGVDAAEAIRRLADEGVATFEVTAIDRDGVLEGPDLVLYEGLVSSTGVRSSRRVASRRSPICGPSRDLGCVGAIVGRALYEGRVTLGAMLAVATEPL